MTQLEAHRYAEGLLYEKQEQQATKLSSFVFTLASASGEAAERFSCFCVKFKGL